MIKNADQLISKLQREKRRLERERLARKQAESILEAKALELYNVNEQLRQLNENLEQKITQRPLELNKAKNAAEHAHRTEQQFLANMSHEIRTPMNAVIGMTHLLYETTLSTSQKEYVDSLRFSADSLMGLINNILDLSKIEAGEIAFEEKPFNLHKLLKGLQQTFQFKLKEKPVNVIIDFDSTIENLIVGDPTRLNQILTNLLGNACKFTQQGTVEIKAKLQRSTSSKYKIALSIIDTGIGIPKEKQDLIFQNFKQADIKVTRKYGGTGLGLAIVKELVEMQKGIIKVKSKEGVGSTFQVNLSFGNSGEKAVEKENKKEIGNAKVTELLQTKSILVVEDNEMNQKLITKILDIWGCNYDLAVNGKEALEFTNNLLYDLILMDIHMPVMDGVMATSLIREDTQNLNQKTPIIAMTAAALLEEKNRGLAAGMNDYVTKPFSPKRLLGKFFQLLNLQPSTEETPDVPSIDVLNQMVKIDLKYLFDFSNGDSDFVRDMVATFIKDTPSSFQLLHTAFAEQNWETVSKTAHRLKPNYMMLGMKEQQATAFQIEQETKKDQFGEQEIYQLIIQMEQATECAYPILEQKLMEI